MRDFSLRSEGSVPAVQADQINTDEVPKYATDELNNNQLQPRYVR